MVVLFVEVSCSRVKEIILDLDLLFREILYLGDFSEKVAIINDPKRPPPFFYSSSAADVKWRLPSP